MSYAPRHIVFNGRLYRMTPGEYETALYHLGNGKAAEYALKQASAQDLGPVEDVTAWDAYTAKQRLNAYYSPAPIDPPTKANTLRNYVANVTPKEAGTQTVTVKARSEEGAAERLQKMGYRDVRNVRPL
jgi:hypothetical protein